MKSADQEEKRSLTESRRETGVADLWTVLALLMQNDVRNQHLSARLCNIRPKKEALVRNQAPAEKKRRRRIRQCEKSGERKIHRDSEAFSQAR